MAHPKSHLDEKDRAAWKIFNVMFQCTVRALDTYSTDHLLLRGMVSTGSAASDKHTANAAVYREMTINGMVELFRSGAKVSVVNVADTKKIYDIVSEHLEDWKTYLQTQMNTRDAPFDDLVELDEFASVVYKHALPHFTREVANDFLGNSLAAQMKASIYRDFNQPTPGLMPDMPTTMPDKRDSLASAFKQHVVGDNGERKWS